VQHQPPPNTEIINGCSYIRLPGRHETTYQQGQDAFFLEYMSFLSVRNVFSKAFLIQKKDDNSCVITIDVLKLELHIISTKKYSSDL